MGNNHVDIREFSVVGYAKTLNTEFVVSAIHAVAESGEIAHLSTNSLSLVLYNEEKCPEFHIFGELPVLVFFDVNEE